MSLSRTLERWGLHPQIGDDEAALLGYEDAVTANRTSARKRYTESAADPAADGDAPDPPAEDTVSRVGGQRRILSQDKGLLATVHTHLETARKPIEKLLSSLAVTVRDLAVGVGRAAGALRDAERDRNRAKERIEVLERTRGRSLSKRRLPTWLYILAMTVFVAAELVLNSSALQIIGENNVVLWILAFSLVIAMLFICHAIGEAMREAEEDRRKRKKVWLWLLAVGVILAFLWAIGGIRVAFLEAGGIRTNLMWALLLQLPVILAAILVAWMHANRYADELDAHAKTVRKARAALRALEVRQAKVQARHDAAVSGLASDARGYLQRAATVQEFTGHLLATWGDSYAHTAHDGRHPPLLEVRQPRWMIRWTEWLDSLNDPRRPGATVPLPPAQPPTPGPTSPTPTPPLPGLSVVRDEGDEEEPPERREAQ
jgi:hypothetical protein